MFKRVLIAAAFVIASCPTFVSAQDFFFSFDEFSRQSSITIDPATTSTGQVFLFSDANLAFDQIDLDFTNNNPSVVAFTGATTTNTDGQFTALSVEAPNNLGAVPVSQVTATDGRLFGLTSGIAQILGINVGIAPANAATDSDFRAGANGFLLAQVDFDVVASGTANFDFILGSLGIIDVDVIGGGEVQVDPDFTGSTATVTVAAIPEPSSAALLILGAAGIVAKRRRS